MPDAIIALKLTKKVPETGADLIGADKGALILARQGCHMKLAIGDFDSVEPEDLKLIRSHTDQMIILNPVKDDSDSEAAIRYALEAGYTRVFLYGSLGGRADHMLVNLRLAMQYPGRVILMDDANRIAAFEKGRHTIAKNGFRYISFFTDSEAVISLTGMKYPLIERRITKDDLYTLSNEIDEEEGILEVIEGRVLVIQSDDAEIKE